MTQKWLSALAPWFLAALALAVFFGVDQTYGSPSRSWPWWSRSPRDPTAWGGPPVSQVPGWEHVT